MPNPLQPLVDRLYGNKNIRGPYFYPESPYGMGDLVPGNMPTRFGPLMPIPDAREILATHPHATVPAEYFNASVKQGAGQQPWVRETPMGPLPVNLDLRPDAGMPVNGQTFMRPMPSIMHPRPDAGIVTVESTGIACWVSEHPVLSVGVAGLVYFLVRGGKR